MRLSQIAARSLLILGSLAPIDAFAQEPAPAAGQPATLPTALAMEAAQAAIEACKETHQTVAAAIVDAAGHARVVIAAEGAGTMAGFYSQAKAQTAVKLNESTGVLKERAKTDPALVQKIKAAGGGDSAGGLPIVRMGMTIGAIGVGGAHGDQYDDQCAKAALAKIAGRY